MRKLPLKYRIRRLIRKPITHFFYWLFRRQSVLLKIGFMGRLRRVFAPTYEEMKEDIFVKHGENVNAAIREVMHLESVKRKIMLPDPLPEEYLRTEECN